MIGLLGIRRVLVPRMKIIESHAHLQRVGAEALEGFVLWAGSLSGDTFCVQETVIPVQTGLRIAGGVCVSVGAEELHRINVWLYKHKLTLIAQLHSHPTNAFHSETDDSFPIVTTVGGFSIVVPNFARQQIRPNDCAVYRLLPQQGWVRMVARDVRETIFVVE